MKNLGLFVSVFLSLVSSFSKADLITHPSLVGHLLGVKSGFHSQEYPYKENTFQRYGHYIYVDSLDKNPKEKILVESTGCRGYFRADYYLRTSETPISGSGPKLALNYLELSGDELYRIQAVEVLGEAKNEVEFRLATQSGKPAGYSLGMKFTCDFKELSLDNLISLKKLHLFLQRFLKADFLYVGDGTAIASDQPASVRVVSHFENPLVFSFKEKKKLADLEASSHQTLCSFADGNAWVTVTLNYLGPTSLEPIYTDPEEIDDVEKVNLSAIDFVAFDKLYTQLELKNANFNLQIHVNKTTPLGISQPVPAGTHYLEPIEKSVRRHLKACGWFNVKE